MLLKSMWFQILKSESRQALALGKSRLAMKNPTGNYFVFAQLNVPGPSKALVGVDLALIILIEPFKIKWVFDFFSWFCLFQSVLSRNWSNFLVEILTNLRNFRKSAGFRPISFDFNPERILFFDLEWSMKEFPPCRILSDPVVSNPVYLQNYFSAWPTLLRKGEQGSLKLVGTMRESRWNLKWIPSGS